MHFPSRLVGLAILSAAALSQAGCPAHLSELERDLGQARATLEKTDLGAAVSPVELPGFLVPVRDLEGNAAADYLEALEDYRGLKRPAPEEDITAVEPGPGFDPAPFAPFAGSEPVERLLTGSRRRECRLTGFLVPIGPEIVDGEVLSVAACTKWTFAVAARAADLEARGERENSLKALLALLSFGGHLEEDAALANCATGRTVRLLALFYLEQFFRRAGDLEKASAAMAASGALGERGMAWCLLPQLYVLSADGKGALEAAEIAIKAGHLALACEVAASVALGKFRNLSESAGGPSPRRFEALQALRGAFDHPAMAQVCERAEAMLVWPAEKAERFAATYMPSVKRYR